MSILKKYIIESRLTREIEKGNISDEGIKKTEHMRPSKERFIAGLNTGSKNIQARHGTIEKEGKRNYYDQPSNTIYLKKGAGSLVRRHESDEARTSQGMIKKVKKKTGDDVKIRPVKIYNDPDERSFGKDRLVGKHLSLRVLSNERKNNRVMATHNDNKPSRKIYNNMNNPASRDEQRNRTGQYPLVDRIGENRIKKMDRSRLREAIRDVKLKNASEKERENDLKSKLGNKLKQRKLKHGLIGPRNKFIIRKKKKQ